MNSARPRQSWADPTANMATMGLMKPALAAQNRQKMDNLTWRFQGLS